ncbi:hypothetical protein LOK49_LG14G00352 [Camellia lanceoleosa]|uniref:Uncharacterized protein n=1 Tax=Camellia lanceoleosa TaxID=1840588 RepID=A0ACC0FA79_9ERIC|nr:hypothetical protein LOK49_LG14G00352 [Camellia lanceoleosa]
MSSSDEGSSGGATTAEQKKYKGVRRSSSEMSPFETVVQLPPVQAVPPPESAPHVPPPLPEAVVQVPHPLDVAAEPFDAPPDPPRKAQQQNLELPKLVVAFCLTAAFEISFRSVQTRKHYPITFQLLCLLMVFALAFLVVAKYIVANYPKPGRLLEHAGLLCGVTAFFVAITVSFPLCLKLISWIIYALSLLAISICNCPPPL